MNKEKIIDNNLIDNKLVKTSTKLVKKSNDAPERNNKNISKHRAEITRPALDGIGRYLPNNAGQRNITNVQRAECVALAENGASIPEIAKLLNLTSPQVERALKKAHDAKIADNVAISIQERKNIGCFDQKLAEKLNKIITKLLDKLTKIVDEEEDMNKITTAIKVLYNISQDNSVKSEITTTISRLRSM